MTRFTPWESHSRAWRAKASSEGMSAQRWNAYGKLSESARKGTSQREYSRGVSIPVQTRAQKEALVVKHIKNAAGEEGRLSTIKRNVKRMSSEELNKAKKLSGDEIRYKARKQGTKEQRRNGYVNPYWYR